MTYRRGTWILGILLLVTLFISEYAGFSKSHLGTMIWLGGILILAIVSPVWGYCLGRSTTGRGHLKWRRWWRP